MHQLPRFLIGLSLLCLSSGLHSVEVYRWQDEQGHTHYSDRGAPGANRLDLRQENSYRRIKRIFDGDTILLDHNDKVRLLGINTPEIESFRKEGQAGGEEARRWLEKQLSERLIRLEFDQEAKDHYGRILAHVFTDTGEHINLALVEAGMAFVDIHPPNLKYAALLSAAQQRAEEARRGVWGMPDYAAKSVNFLDQHSLRGWQRLTGIPVRITDTRTYRKLVFTEKFEAHIRKDQIHLFPSLEQYLGKKLEVRGWISRNRDHYSMLVRHPSALIDSTR
jgi:micrococcal nuclease